jgi:hypothetical protein
LPFPVCRRHLNSLTCSSFLLPFSKYIIAISDFTLHLLIPLRGCKPWYLKYHLGIVSILDGRSLESQGSPWKLEFLASFCLNHAREPKKVLSSFLPEEPHVTGALLFFQREEMSHRDANKTMNSLAKSPPSSSPWVLLSSSHKGP